MKSPFRFSRRMRAALALLAGLVVLVASPAAAQDVDNELWLDQSLSVTLTPRTSLQLSAAQRLDRGAAHLFQAYWQAGAGFEVRPWLTVAPAYRHTRSNPLDPSASYEHRALLDLTLRARRGNWQHILRTRLEGRFQEGRAAFFRGRLRPEVQYALPGGARRPALSFSNEFQWDSRSGTFVRNRARAGIRLPVTAQFSLTPYYMLESNRIPGGWDHDNVWGLSLGWRY